MRVGICAYWFNRGQGVVARQIRSALDSLGHETFVLARPTRAGNIRPAFVDHTGVWDQPNVTDASAYRIPPEEVVAWGREGQVERELGLLEKGAARDSRVEVVLEDLPMNEHMRLFAAADVCVAPSRWEGLGLHLYESMALGLPVIANDNPPINEVIADGENGLLVRGRRRGRAKSGIPAYLPDVRGLTDAMRQVRDPDRLAALRRGVVAARERLRWERTVADYAALLDSAR
jgi:glycosyltransferase involved in cell wall biosynthesis